MVFALILTLILTACSPKVASVGQAASNSALTQGEANALTGPTQLMVGTFKLEDTANAVTAQQAAELLPLWKAYRSLSGDSSSAAAELEALQKQIEQAMIAEQLKAITEVKLTSQDMMITMQNLGLSMPEQVGVTSSSDQASQGQQPPAGDMPPADAGGGGGPGGPGGGPGGPSGADTGLSPTQRQTQQAQRSSAGGGSSPLLDALIKLLESKEA